MSLKKDYMLKSIQAAYRESTAGSWNTTNHFIFLCMHVHTTPAKKMQLESWDQTKYYLTTCSK